MGKPEIKEKVKLALVARAGGRCEYRGCQERLDLDNLTRKKGNFTHFAHIVAESPAGTRGDPVRSPKLAQSIDNLMLLCFKHHRMIDEDDKAGHPEELLLEMKKEHEAMVAVLMEPKAMHKARMIVFRAKIGDRIPAISRELAQAAMFWEGMYPDGPEVLIDMTSRADDPAEYTAAIEQLVLDIRAGLRSTLDSGRPALVAAFGLAPIPLLMVFGRVLGDIDSIRVFQKNREPDTWAWAKEPSQAKDGFALTKGGGALGTKNVALALSVSGLIHVSEVLTVARQCENAIWHIQASEPKTDYVRSASQLAEFSALFRQAISEIQAAHGSDVTIHLFPAVPNSVAIECGRRLLPNANPAIKVYNSVAGIGWRFALDLLPANKA